MSLLSFKHKYTQPPTSEVGEQGEISVISSVKVKDPWRVSKLGMKIGSPEQHKKTVGNRSNLIILCGFKDFLHSKNL